MTLRHMRIFVAVCRTGSTTLAAKQLFMSQPTISISVQKLEEEYGAKLFDRIANRMVPTDAGACMLQYAEHIVQLFDEMADAVSNQATNGTLRIGSTHNIGGFLMPMKINRFKELYPEIKVRLLSDKLETVVEAISQNELDVAIVEGEPDNPYIISLPIGNDRLMFICPPGHKFAGRNDVTLEELIKEPIILRSKGNSVRDYFDALLTSHGYHVEPVWECGTNFPLIMGVHNGIGISVAPRLHAFEVIHSRECATFAVKGLQNPITNISAIYHKNKNISQAAKDFIALWDAKDFIALWDADASLTDNIQRVH